VNERRAPLAYAFGDRIADKYQLIRPLAAGGMGVVWVAHNLTLDVHVAIKLIRGALGGKVAASRLLYEARSAARIAHPGVVRIYDFGITDRGDPFIVMELLEGETLRDLLDREQRLDPLRAAALMLPVAEALATLAENGIIHRDLKPDNVILVRAGEDRVQPKLVDFGVALLPGTERLTADGLVVGTPDYLAPEQATADEIDGRVDVWAFSLILFELVTGGRPFTGETPTMLMTRILVDTPASITAYGVREPELAAIISKGLAKAREDRWETIRAEGHALAAWARQRGLTEDVTGATVRERASDASPRWPVMGGPPSAHSVAKTEISARRRHWGAPSQPGWGPRRDMLGSYPDDAISSRAPSPMRSPPPPPHSPPHSPPRSPPPRSPPTPRAPMRSSPTSPLAEPIPVVPSLVMPAARGPAPLSSQREQAPFVPAPALPSLVMPSPAPPRGPPQMLPQQLPQQMLPPRGPAPLMLPRLARGLKTTEVFPSKRPFRLRLGIAIGIVLVLIVLVATAIYRAGFGWPAGSNDPAGSPPGSVTTGVPADPAPKR
jgi:eukaryotic-like serine/threonine-protein kinase